MPTVRVNNASIEARKLVKSGGVGAPGTYESLRKYEGGPTAEGEFLVELPLGGLTWSDDHVQFFMELDAHDVKERAEYLSTEGGPVLRSAFYTETLTRKNINDLINNLRRARDRVYGKDA